MSPALTEAVMPSFWGESPFTKTMHNGFNLNSTELSLTTCNACPPNSDEYELHASEMRNAKKPDAGNLGQKQSVWSAVDRPTRHRILDASYQLIADFQPSDARQPISIFGVAIDSRFHGSETQPTREQFAYEVLLNKFDMMLKSVKERRDMPNRGLVIHDRRVVVERDVQNWTAQWRKSAGDIGQLRNLADVPLFADSRASRLLQLADLVSHAIYRRYRPGGEGDTAFATIFPKFHTVEGVLHGCVHLHAIVRVRILQL